jgi:hypothetical protein
LRTPASPDSVDSVMEMVRTVVVNAYQAARLRGEGYVAAFDKALAIYRELSPNVSQEYARAEVERLLSVRLPADSDVMPAPRDNGHHGEPALASMELAEMRRRLDTLERRQDEFDRTLTLIQRDTSETRHMLASISTRLDRVFERAEAPSEPRARPEPDPGYRHAAHEEAEEAAQHHHAHPDMHGMMPVWIAWPMWSMWLLSWWMQVLSQASQPRR